MTEVNEVRLKVTFWVRLKFLFVYSLLEHFVAGQKELALIAVNRLDWTISRLHDL